MLLLTTYFVIQYLVFQTGILEYITFLIGPLVYLVFLNRVHTISVLLIKWIIIVFLFLTIIILFRIPGFYDILNWLTQVFISRSQEHTSSSIRGVSLLTPEPSYFAFPLILLLSIIDLKLEEENIKSLKKYRLVLFFIALVTKSALVFFYLIFYLLGKYLSRYSLNLFKIKFSTKNIVIGISLIVILLMPFLFLRNSRPVQVAENVYKSVSKGDMFGLLFRESSGSTRFIINTLGVISIQKEPFGWGIGEFKYNFFKAGNTKFKEVIKKHEVLRAFYYNDNPVKTQTYLTNLTGDIGIFSLPLFLFIIISIYKAKGETRGGIKWVIPLMLIIVQGQMSNPAIWIILAILNSNKFDTTTDTITPTKNHIQ
ncbi:hypothetical protein [Aquimarina longa]|uniref:hypothetical protein n=1 Tax=Aquimarina longa TaxID=1080221 RepID=UPI0011DF7436|nr:hypothetical protein [Aquimarina longa]